jgi:DNA-binding PadR family transcriptional regulator
MKRLSDLETTILGIVYKKAPCTSYAVAQEFFTSTSSYWRGSAGTVYPAVKRLTGLGLLKRSWAVRLGRACSLYELTPKGRAVLRRWLSPPLPDAAASITLDPIRTRAFFLAALSAGEQRAFVDEAEQRLLAQIPRLEAQLHHYRQIGDWFSEQAQHGTLYTMQARLAWIRALRRALERRPRDRAAPANGKRAARGG